jgi:hypothetical protein
MARPITRYSNDIRVPCTLETEIDCCSVDNLSVVEYRMKTQIRLTYETGLEETMPLLRAPLFLWPYNLRGDTRWRSWLRHGCGFEPQ